MGRLILRSGAVGDYDGAYDWVRKEDYDNPDYTPGHHKSKSGWPEDSYMVVETVEADEVATLREVARVGIHYFKTVDKGVSALLESKAEEALRDALTAVRDK